MKKAKLQDIGLTGNQSIFINTSLCPYYQMMWSSFKRLHELEHITIFYNSSGTIKVKIPENGSPIAIKHAQDFEKYFSEVDLLPTFFIRYSSPI